MSSRTSDSTRAVGSGSRRTARDHGRINPDRPHGSRSRSCQSAVRNPQSAMFIDRAVVHITAGPGGAGASSFRRRSEEHTSELQSHHDLVCRLLLEKKKKNKNKHKSV